MTIKKRTIGTIGTSIDDFNVLGQIGTGGSAEVFKVQSLNSGYNGKCFALKKIRKFRQDGQNCIQRIDKEVEIHRQLQNDSILKFFDYFEDEMYGYIVLELCERGSLQEYIKYRHPISEEKACHFIKQVINGVAYLKSMQIIHRDLSLKNLMLTHDDEIKIADFGLAIKSCNKVQRLGVVGTVNFMAPEVFDGYYDFKTDCWSVGCVLYALLFGSPPFDGKKKEDIQRRIKTCELTFPDYASREAKELLMDMLQKDARKRINVIRALNYAFFKKHDKSYKVAYQKNTDSGMSSLSNSSSSISHPSKVYNSNSKGLERKFKYREESSSDRNSDYCKRTVDQYDDDNIKTNWSRCLSSSQQLKCSTPIMENVSYTGNEPRSQMQMLPKYQVSHDSIPSSYKNPNFKDITEISSQMHSFRLENGCITSTKIQENMQKNSSDSHQYYAAEMNSIHNSNSFQQSLKIPHKRSDSYYSFKSSEKDSKIIQMKNVRSNEVSKSALPPLSTVRLKRRRSRMNNFYFSILNDGQFCMEILKTVKSKEYVSTAYFISGDGRKIKVFKPKRKIPLSNEPPQPKNSKEVHYFTLENLTDSHRKKYRIAKVFIDMVRAKTAKVTIYEKFAKCIMMENAPNPDFEIEFYNGFLITEVKGNIRIMDQNHQDVPENTSNAEFMLSEFQRMKEACKDLEMYIESNHKANFPVIIGSKPDVTMKQSNKENINSPLNGTATTTKSINFSKILDSNITCNSQKSSTSIMNEKNVTNSSKKAEDLLDLEKCQLVGDKWVISEYKDGIQIFISIKDDQYIFRDVNTQERIPECPDLMNRLERDSPKILRHALSKEVQKKS